MRNHILKLAAVSLTILPGLTSCSDIDDKPFVPDRKASGIDIGNLDTSVRPADDFYQYASQPLPTIDGFTADQRFFLSYANVWAQNITEAEIRHHTTTNVHSLPRWRVNGALPHIDAWYEAFDVKEGDKLYIPKEKRLYLW